ncbi:MAG TPA: BtpA/SgcQ family protein [Thermoanaerobaculia bacterium]|nr:BtpA/SgcQ family protein [Thermoanaerobaculia bacterium]
MVVSGTATGAPCDAGEVRAVSEVVSVPTLIGSGITPENIALYREADAFFVGSSVKVGGVWSGALDAERVRAVVDAFGVAGREQG